VSEDPLAVLQRIRSTPRPLAGERCDMCAESIADRHEHVVNTESRSVLCTCRGCWLLFTSNGAAGGKYRAVPDRCVALGPLSVAAGAWEALQIPVSVAFFFRNSQVGVVTAFYPGPAGATQSLLPLDAWDELVASNHVLTTLVDDVEALLVRRDERHDEAFVVPIDACYELVGELRRRWKGFGGGTEAHDALDAFFDGLRERAR